MNVWVRAETWSNFTLFSCFLLLPAAPFKVLPVPASGDTRTFKTHTRKRGICHKGSLPCGRSGGNWAIQVKANSGWHSRVSHVFLCWDSSQIHSHSALTFPLMSRVWTTKKVVKPQHLCCAARKVECLQVPQYRCEAEAKVPSLHSS